jgi:uroporphyrinogen decarboxylase
MIPDFERLKKAVKHKEPDRIPLCEARIDYSIQSQFLGREVKEDDIDSQIRFWEKAGYDFIPLTVGLMAGGKVTQESAISKVIKNVVLKDSETAGDEKNWNLELSSFIRDRRDFEAFPWDAAADVDLSLLIKAEKLLPAGMKVVAISGKIFTLGWMLMGFNNFALSLLTDERLVADVVGKISEIQIKALERIFRIPHVGGVWIVDDIAFGTGLMISPQALRDHLFPHYRKIIEKCHDHGLIVFFHSDGDLMKIVEDLIALEIDVLHPIDPTCMDIFRVKREFGSRICIAGNVSNELLRQGKPNEVEKLIKDLIRELGPGGGYLAGSGNSVPDWAKFDNYMAMRNTVLHYGSYPISKLLSQ